MGPKLSENTLFRSQSIKVTLLGKQHLSMSLKGTADSDVLT